MSLLLYIDTAVQSASVCLSQDNTILATRVNPSERESAAWLHVAIEELLQEQNVRAGQLAAIAVSNGPGSYTGLRVGLSAAKGLCYALNIPLITLNTLQIMAAGLKTVQTELVCPMIDARRMEVFTALFDRNLQEVMPTTNLILDETSFATWLEKYSITFLGNGSIKWQDISNHSNTLFVNYVSTAADMVNLAVKKFEAGQFSDLAYGEPFYGKDFHSSLPKKNY